MRTIFARHPQVMIKRLQDPRGFTIIHGDVGVGNVLAPRQGDRPIYLIDRQPPAVQLEPDGVAWGI